MEPIAVKPYDIKDWATCRRDESGEVAIRPEWQGGGREGRLPVSRVGYRKALRASLPGEAMERNLSWSDMEKLGRTPDAEINWKEVRALAAANKVAPWRAEMQAERDKIRLG